MAARFPVGLAQGSERRGVSGAPYDISWWPPKAGDKLIRNEQRTAYVCHVLAVFEHDGQTHAAIAWYGKHKQWWHYEVVSPMDAAYAKFWRHGTECPNASIAKYIREGQ